MDLNAARHALAAAALAACLLSSFGAEAGSLENIPSASTKAYAITVTERIGRAENPSATKYSTSVVGLAGQAAQSRILTA